MPDLHTRLLAEIERREEDLPLRIIRHGSRAGREHAYLAALRKIVEMHERDGGYCDSCGEESLGDWCIVKWPCPTVAAVAEGIGVQL